MAASRDFPSPSPTLTEEEKTLPPPLMEGEEREREKGGKVTTTKVSDVRTSDGHGLNARAR